VHQQRAGFESEQQLLGASADAHDPLPGNLARQIARYGPAQPRLVHREPGDAAAANVRRKAAPRRFDFGQFGQAT
jgi:hypothetical protein